MEAQDGVISPAFVGVPSTPMALGRSATTGPTEESELECRRRRKKEAQQHHRHMKAEERKREQECPLTEANQFLKARASGLERRVKRLLTQLKGQKASCVCLREQNERLTLQNRRLQSANDSLLRIINDV